jgi:hypothetical protein
LSLRNENPACEKKTPEYSGVFFGQEENIGFSWRSQGWKKFVKNSKTFYVYFKYCKNLYCNENIGFSWRSQGWKKFVKNSKLY